MILTIIISLISLILLIVFHELGHFLIAKKFGIKVEEFGIGYPPRLFGKKFGETIYSINLLPLGGFVRIYGHEKRIKDSRSFSEKPIWQRALVILGGVIVFWIIAAILLSIVMYMGVPTQIEDSQNDNLVQPRVQIIGVIANSPAEKAGIKIGDSVKSIEFKNESVNITKVKELQEFTEEHQNKEITLTIERGKQVFETSLVPRQSYPEGQGPIGVSLARTSVKSYSWYEAPVQGILATINLTALVVKGWGMTIASLVQGNGVPDGIEVKGPIGIFELFAQMGSLGVGYFLRFIALISVSLALLNILPIPALDGGWLMFIMIEKIRGKAVTQKIEQGVTVFFFFLLIALMVYVTIKDVIHLLF
jgi:regulator of sigma E protease